MFLASVRGGATTPGNESNETILLSSLLLLLGLGLVLTSSSLALSLDFLKLSSSGLTLLVDDFVSEEELLLVELSSGFSAVVDKSKTG